MAANSLSHNWEGRKYSNVRWVLTKNGLLERVVVVPATPSGARLMIPAFGSLSLVSVAVAHDPVAKRYRELFAMINWSTFGGDPDSSKPGPKPQPADAFLKALIVKLSLIHISEPTRR